MFHDEQEGLFQDLDQTPGFVSTPVKNVKSVSVFEGFQFQHVGDEIVQMFLQGRSQFLIAACHQAEH